VSTRHGLLVSRGHTTFKYPIDQILSMTSATTTQQQQGITDDDYSIEDNLGRLQQEILKRIANSDQRFTVNQLATILNKGHTTIFKSTDLLIRQNYLTFDQDYERGRKWLKLTELGAFLAIAYYSETMPYTTVYRNHPYLQMPKLFTKLAACTFDDRSKSELIFEFATRILLHGPPLVVRSEGTIDLSEQGEVGHHLAALILDTIWAFLSRKNNNPKEINYRQVNDLLTTASNIFDYSVKRIRAKANTYQQRPIIRGMQKKKKDDDDVPPIAEEGLLETTNEPTYSSAA
jgi:hypothetical protein